MKEAAKNVSAKQIRSDIAQLEWANAMFRAANRALARGDFQALEKMGFSDPHVAELVKSGGFDSRAIRSNSRTITYLRKQLGLKDSLASETFNQNRHQSRTALG